MDKTYFEKWQEGLHGYTNLSSFQTYIMKAYQIADGNNRKILQTAYPSYFTIITPLEKAFNNFTKSE